jgi:hypothetical protein
MIITSIIQKVKAKTRGSGKEKSISGFSRKKQNFFNFF